MLYIPDFSRAEDPREEPLVVHRHGNVPGPALLILMHGLGGKRYRTWTPRNADPTQISLPKFLYDDIGNLDVGLYAYRTLWDRVGWGRSIELEVEAKVLADTLRDLVQLQAADTYSTIILAGHSMGGILARAAVRELIQRDERRTLGAVKALFLLATPQAGSLRIFRWLQWFSADMRALAPHGKLVTSIAEIFTDRVVGEAAHAGLSQFVIPSYVIAVAEDKWVDLFSAGVNVRSERKRTVRGSHKSPVKPRTKNDDAYRWVRDQIIDLIRDLGQKPNPFEACDLGGKLLINRARLRESIGKVTKDGGETKVVAVKGPPRCGKSHSIYFIEHIERLGHYEKAVIRLEEVFSPATFAPDELAASILNLINADATRIPSKRPGVVDARWVQMLAMHVVGHIKARPNKVLVVLDGFSYSSVPTLTRDLILELIRHADREPRLRIALLDCGDDLLVAQTAGRLAVEQIEAISDNDLRNFFISLARAQERASPTSEVLDEIVRDVRETAPAGDATYNEKIAQVVEAWTEKLKAVP